MANETRRVGESVTTADGQNLGQVCGTLWCDESGREIVGVTGGLGTYILAATASELDDGGAVGHTYEFVASGPSVAEVDQLLTDQGLQAVVSRLDDHYRIGFTIPPGPPGRTTAPPEWLRDIIEADPVPSDEPTEHNG